MPCKDGHVGMNLLTRSQWELFCAFVGMPELLENPNYAFGIDLIAHSEEVLSKLAPWFLDRNADDIFHEGQSWRIPVALVPTTSEVMEFAQHKERGFFVEVDHPATGRVTYPGAPFKMSESPQQISRHAPLLGEHNEEVYCQQLGYSRSDLVRLSEMGVI
jgi:crotonobetainyl-CoA:carnitine CoA-transferase CaiB-like acyl-CoA transferase